MVDTLPETYVRATVGCLSWIFRQFSGFCGLHVIDKSRKSLILSKMKKPLRNHNNCQIEFVLDLRTEGKARFKNVIDEFAVLFLPNRNDGRSYIIDDSSYVRYIFDFVQISFYSAFCAVLTITSVHLINLFYQHSLINVVILLKFSIQFIYFIHPYFGRIKLFLNETIKYVQVNDRIYKIWKVLGD